MLFFLSLSFFYFCIVGEAVQGGGSKGIISFLGELQANEVVNCEDSGGELEISLLRGWGRLWDWNSVMVW